MVTPGIAVSVADVGAVLVYAVGPRVGRAEGGRGGQTIVGQGLWWNRCGLTDSPVTATARFRPWVPMTTSCASAARSISA